MGNKKRYVKSLFLDSVLLASLGYLLLPRKGLLSIELLVCRTIADGVTHIESRFFQDLAQHLPLLAHGLYGKRIIPFLGTPLTSLTYSIYLEKYWLLFAQTGQLASSVPCPAHTPLFSRYD
jgi:hypothetical protein